MSAGVAVPADKRFRRPDHRPTRRRRVTRLAARTLAAALGIGLVAAGALWLGRAVVDSSWLRVHQLVVTGTSRLPPATVESLLDDMRGQSILRIDFDRYRQTVLASPWVADVTLWRRLPSTIQVRVRERAPLAIARAGESLYLVDAEGVLLDAFGPAYADLDLPIVSGLVDRTAAVGGRADPARVQLAGRFLDALSAAPALRDRLSDIDVSASRDVTVLLDGETAVLHLGDTRFVERLTLYLDLAPTLGREIGTIDTVDLRFDERVFVKPGAGRRNVR
jgi:cell division protein FtsQ